VGHGIDSTVDKLQIVDASLHRAYATFCMEYHVVEFNRN